MSQTSVEMSQELPDNPERRVGENRTFAGCSEAVRASARETGAVPAGVDARHGRLTHDE